MRPRPILACLLAMLWGWGVAAGVASAQGPDLTISVNRSQFAPGDTLTVFVGVNNDGRALVVDFYLVVILPDGQTVLAFPQLSPLVAVAGTLSNLAAIQPTAPGVELAAPFGFAAPVLRYTWTGGEPEGPYQVTLAAVISGAFADNRADPGDVVAFANEFFTFSNTPGSTLGDVVQIAAGANHTCALRADGSVHCWGRNRRGQLGNGSFPDPSAVPVRVVGLFHATAIAAGADHTCARLANGSVACWGENGLGQLGDGRPSGAGESPLPVVVSGIVNATAITAGRDHTCARLADGTAQCWGANESRQLGNAGAGTQASLVPVPVTGLSGVTALEAGGQYTCARLVDGTVRCWGANGFGQLGIGSVGVPLLPALPVAGISTATAITTGFAHTCARLAAGEVRCWGANASGQLGNPVGTMPCAVSSGSVPCSPVPLQAVPAEAVAARAGFAHTCARLARGGVQCWGLNDRGQLGDGTTVTRSTPVTSVFNEVTAIAAGVFHTCVRVSDGSVDCWGGNEFGELGNGTFADRIKPPSSFVFQRLHATTLGRGFGGGFACAVVSDGTIRCWGANNFGQRGAGSVGVTALVTTVSGISTAADVATGSTHACALLVDGTVQCWGANDRGQLGSPTPGDSSVPIARPGVATAIAIAAGGDYSCALLVTGSVQCWGFSTTTFSDATAIAGGTGRNNQPTICALRVDGAVNCVGAGPSFPPGSSTAIVAGHDFACAVRANGTVQCGGTNGGAFTGADGLSNVTTLADGSNFFCARRADGTVQCAGFSPIGTCLLPPGFGGTGPCPPTLVPGGSTAAAIAGGDKHACFLLADGAVQCLGEVGLGPLSAVPRTVEGF